MPHHATGCEMEYHDGLPQDVNNWPTLMTICEADHDRIDINIRNKLTWNQAPRQYKDVRKKWKDRYSQAVTPAHFLANLLLPSHQGKCLADEEKNEAMEYARKRFPTLAPFIMKFQAKSHPFQPFKFPEAVTGSVTAAEWWKTHQDQRDRDSLCTVCQRLSAAASSAGVERVQTRPFKAPKLSGFRKGIETGLSLEITESEINPN